jgi:hypothetical protein
MLGIPIRYLLKHPVLALKYIGADPLQVFLTMQDYYIEGRERRGPKYQYISAENWEQRLHELLAVSWPCDAAAEFWDLWPAVMRELGAKGIQAGPESFKWWNDGDAGLVRAIWCLVRHLKPKRIVETGVAHGVTSRFILEALKRNGDGQLWSIDLPPLEKNWRIEIGAAVGNGHADRWSLIRGSSRRRLPELLSRLGTIDLFIHDSMHSERNVRFELDLAWHALTPTGALVVDDVDANWGFQTFTQAFSIREALICEAEPLRPDPRRFNNKGQFGIVLRRPNARA